MSRTHAALLLLTAACGRVAFDPLATDGGEDSDAFDATLTAPCPISVVAADPVPISGTTFEYMTFQNDFVPVPSVVMDALDQNGGLVTTTTSSNTGAYTLSIPTGGAPRVAIVHAAATGYFKSVVAADTAYTANTTGAGQAVWTVGDVPLWNNTNMDQIYTTAGITRVTTRGTLNIAVRDCGGNVMDGVTVSIDPPPEPMGELRYQGADGKPALPQDLSVTEMTFGHVLVFNAIAGPTRITASKAGVVFPEVTVVVEAGQVNTLTLIRGSVQ